MSATCVHHWRIASPQGATSVGRCRKCGERREFQNGERQVPMAELVSRRHDGLREAKAAAAADKRIGG